MNDLLLKRKKKSIAYALREVRAAFQNAMQEIRSDYMASVTDTNSIPSMREEFNAFATHVAEAVKQFDIHKRDNVITASRLGTVADVIKIAIEAHRKGHEEEAKKLFCYAAVSSGDVISELNAVPNVTHACQQCSADLMILANFCSVCGTKTDKENVVLTATVTAKVDEVKPLEPTVANAIKLLIKAEKFDEADELLKLQE